MWIGTVTGVPVVTTERRRTCPASLPDEERAEPCAPTARASRRNTIENATVRENRTVESDSRYGCPARGPPEKTVAPPNVIDDVAVTPDLTTGSTPCQLPFGQAPSFPSTVAATWSEAVRATKLRPLWSDLMSSDTVWDRLTGLWAATLLPPL